MSVPRDRKVWKPLLWVYAFWRGRIYLEHSHRAPEGTSTIVQVPWPGKRAFCMLVLNPRDTVHSEPHGQTDTLGSSPAHWARLTSRQQGLRQNRMSETKLRLLSFRGSESIETHTFEGPSFGDSSHPQSPPLAFENPKPFLPYPWLNPILRIKEINACRGNITKEGLSYKIFEKKSICINHI